MKIWQKHFGIEGGAAKQAAAIRNVMARPNVHAAPHYEDAAAEYGTPNNCTTLSGEDKRRQVNTAAVLQISLLLIDLKRFFKKAVTQTSLQRPGKD